MRVWNCGKFIEMEIGQRVLVAHCGSGRSYFGEFGRLERTTNRHLVFVTDSGAIVKTAIDNLHHVVGKAVKEHYFVSTNIEGREDMIHQSVRFWDEKNFKFVNK